VASKLRWLLVGPGDIAQKRVAPALASAEGSEIAGIVYSTRKDRALALADAYGVPQVFDDFNTALDRSDAGAVYLATPVWLHSAHAVQALESGRHVLIEKPLGLSEADCLPVLHAAEKTGLTAGCAYYRRCFPRYRHAVEMLAAGEFGKVVYVCATWFSWFDPSPHDPKYWRVIKRKSGGGPLLDIASHMLDLIIGLFGLPISVHAVCDSLAHEWDVEDTASLVMKLDCGAHAVGMFGWSSGTWRHDFQIAGTGARLDWQPCDCGPVTKTVGREVKSLDMPNADNVHLPLVEDFVRAVLDRRPPVCPVQEAVKTNQLLDAAYASAAQGRQVKVRP